MRDFCVPPTRCPACGHTVTGALNPDDEQEPKPGDYSVCIECASAAMYGADLSLQAVTAEQIAADGMVETIEAARELVKLAHRATDVIR